MNEDWRVIASQHPVGAIGVISSYLGRYREFDVCLSQIQAPNGCPILWHIGINAAFNLNETVRGMKEEHQWLWILGDDHVFKPDLLLKLLQRDVDVVVPLCLRRSYPYHHVIHEGKDNEKQAFGRAPYDFLDGQSGLIDVTGKTIGNAGMLIKRHVLEAIPDPWFEVGKTHPEVMGGDLYFCHKAFRAGFKLFLDTDNPIGHINHMAVWPYQDEKTGKWCAEVRKAGDVLGVAGLCNE